MRREAHARVQGPGARVVGLDLEPCRRGTLGQRPAGQGGHDRGGQTLPAQGRVDLHRRETGPAPVDHTAADRRRHARVRAGHGREPHGRPAAQHLQGHPAHALALVPAEPRLVRLARQHDWPVPSASRSPIGASAADPHLRGHLARPPPRLQLRAQQLLRALGTGRGLHVRGQSRGRVPLPYERRARRRAGRPGRRAAARELARRVNPAAARSSHSPSRSLSTGCQARAATRASSSYEAAGPRRRAGAAGTTLPATSADSGIRTLSPDRRVISSTPSSHDVRTPTVSVNFSPSATRLRVNRRTETRFPTSAGVTRTSRRPRRGEFHSSVHPSCSDHAQERRY